MKVTATANGLKEFDDEVERIVDRVLDLEEFWRSLGSWWEKRESRLFTAGGPLKALKSSTIRRKGGDARPLVRTGALRDAVLSGDPAKATRTDAYFGIPKGQRERPVAILHLHGARGKAKRDPVPKVSTDERGDIADKLREYILKEVR